MSTAGEPPDNPDRAEPGTDRVITLSDAVIAIALTLLVLNLHSPRTADPDAPRQLATALRAMSTQYLAYVVAFATIAGYWIIHHRLFRRLRGIAHITWPNFGFLFFICVLPFTSEVLGDHGGNPLAVTLFALNLMLASATLRLMQILAGRAHLLDADPDETVAQDRLQYGWFTVVLLGSVVVAWTVSADWGEYAWLLMLLAPFLNRAGRHRTAAA